MEDLNSIKQALIKHYGLPITVDDHYLLKHALARINPIFKREDYVKLRKLMLNFSESSNILALRLIYNNYVK